MYEIDREAPRDADALSLSHAHDDERDVMDWVACRTNRWMGLVDWSIDRIARVSDAGQSSHGSDSSDGHQRGARIQQDHPAALARGTLSIMPPWIRLDSIRWEFLWIDSYRIECG